jgi:hypothetical protein
VKRALLLLAVAACAKFEDPSTVIDLRPIAVSADLPEQVIDISATTTADQVLAQLSDTHLGVLLSDLNFERRIRWSAEVCNLDSAGRCDHSAPYETLGSGFWDDPDAPGAPPGGYPLTIPADGNLIGILYDELQSDTLHGLGGEYFGISLKIGGEGADPSLDQYVGKEMLVSPRIPADRTPNHNPTIDHIDTYVNDDMSATYPLPLGRCSDLTGASPMMVHAKDKVRLQPVELSTTRETYSVPTIDGMTRTFTEAVTYQWLATAGSFSDSTTGGGHDPFGNLAPLHTDWTAPSSVKSPVNVWLWIIVRDERYGLTWYQACVTVAP